MNPPWYKNKGILSDIFTVLVSAYMGLSGSSLVADFSWHLPAIPAWAFTLLGAIGLWHQTTNP